MTETDDPIELVHGSGNVFADLGMPNPEQRQLRAILAASIIKTLDAERLTVRAAEAKTGIAAVVAFHASDEARWLTGLSLAANGGLVTTAANILARAK